MNDNTRLRIKVPKALYESIQLELNKKHSAEKHDMEEGLRDGMYNNFAKWKESFPEDTEFKEEKGYMMAKDKSGKELGKWNPSSMLGSHADDFQYKSLEEAGMGVEYAWIPGALAALGIVGTIAKEIKAHMVKHKLKGLEGIYKAYKEVGKGASGTIDDKMSGKMEEKKGHEVEKKDALAEAIKKVLDKKKEADKKKKEAEKKAEEKKKEEEKKAADKKKEADKKKKEAEKKK
jgi:hypothetical protein